MFRFIFSFQSHFLINGLLTIVLSLVVVLTSEAAVVYDLTVTPFMHRGNELSAMGQLEFMGDLSIDGTFGLDSDDVTDFSLTFTCVEGSSSQLACFNPFNSIRGNLFFGFNSLEYTVVGGVLNAIDLGEVSSRFYTIGRPSRLGTSTGFGALSFPSQHCDFDRQSCSSTYTLTQASPNPVPAPNVWLLMATGLVGLTGYQWHQRRHEKIQLG